MYTEDLEIIKNSININTKFANVMYNKMMTKRYGVQSCLKCGSNDNIGGYNKHILSMEMLMLGEMCDRYLEGSFEHNTENELLIKKI